MFKAREFLEERPVETEILINHLLARAHHIFVIQLLNVDENGPLVTNRLVRMALEAFLKKIFILDAYQEKFLDETAAGLARCVCLSDSKAHQLRLMAIERGYYECARALTE